MPSDKKKQAKKNRKQAMKDRAARCAEVAAQHGYGRMTRLFWVLADYGAISDRLPFPSQEKLAEECGVSERTIRRWLVVLERLGLVDVRRAPARPTGTGGKWTRQTNRYILCDRRAARVGESVPLPRRFRSTKPQHFTPRGHQGPLTLTGIEPKRAVLESVGPVSGVENRFVETIVVESAPPITLPNNLVAVTTKPDPKRSREGLSAARAALKRARNR